MLNNNILKNLLHQQSLSKTDKVLLCLAEKIDKPKAIAEVKNIAKNAGLGIAQKWNISNLLSKSNGRAIRTPNGWELSEDGKTYVCKITGVNTKSAPPKAAVSLKTELSKIKDQAAASFVEEAILCFESKFYRASVVLAWVGAVSVLYDYTLRNKLQEFNAEAIKRNPKWRIAKNGDDLARMKEHEFLEVLESISVIGKSVKQELDVCLKLRNGCGHPNTLIIGENRVSAHIESLILNVFSRFA